jgi:inner membrane protein
MKSNTHLLGGIASAALYRAITDSPPDHLYQELTYYASAVLGSVLPDLCHPGSFLGKKSVIISRTISKTFGHRTITHSWVMIAAIMWVTQIWDGIYTESLSRGLLLGVISHIILDSATSRGVQLFYPLPIRFRFPIYTKTGSKTEDHIAALIGFLSALLMTNIYIMRLF